MCRGNLGRAENRQHWTGGLEGEHIHTAGPFQGGMGMGRAVGLWWLGVIGAPVPDAAESKTEIHT